MMDVIDGRTAQAADRIAMEEYGLSSLRLMHRASKAVADYIRKYVWPDVCDRMKEKVCVTVLSGVGNNGADGLCIARLLRSAGIETEAILCGEPCAATWECLYQFSECRRSGVPVRRFVPGEAWHSDGILVDALFGVGLNRPIEGIYETCIREAAAQTFAHVVAVDIPSGIHADSGSICRVALRADTTVTIGKCKRGLLQAEGKIYSGKVVVRRIGVPAEAYQKALATHSKTV